MQQQVEEQEESPYEVPRMEVESVIGFNGSVQNGLKVHPDRQHFIYPLGCAVVIENISNAKQNLLWGHTDYVTCITISSEAKNGELIASGQRTHMGFKADVIVWHYPSQHMLYTLKLHKVNIQALAFSPNDLYLATLGGCDDGSVAIWDMANGKPICGSPAQVESAGDTLCICFSKKDDHVFVTGGESTLRVWELDVENRKIRPSEVDMGQRKRRVECIQMDDDGARPFFFCGTSTGDILAINMKSKHFQFSAPEKNNFEKGVTVLAHLKNSNFLVGTGCGKLYELRFPLPADNCKTPMKPKVVRCWQDETVMSNREAAITSIAPRGTGHQFFVGTANARIYKFSYENSKLPQSKFEHCELLKTCHSDKVQDVIFPQETSEIIVTCQREQIRIWSVKDMKELNRYIVPNMTCTALALACDGQAIVSAWEDGVIRLFGFNKERNIVLKESIMSAHNKGVTALACTKNLASCGEWDFKIISGGGEGQVRIWHFRNNNHSGCSYSLMECLKEHKGSVTDIKIRSNDQECISASTDGTCIIWNLVAAQRIQTVFANTLFKCACYGSFEEQIITSGTDRKIAYWEIYDGSPIRDVEGAKSGSVNAMDISHKDGEVTYFVTGGDDKILKVWKYDEGEVGAVGVGHSATITRVRICPNRKYIVSASEDGAVIVWKFPKIF